MLMPKKVKYRKQQRGRMKGKAWRGSTVAPRVAAPRIRPFICLRYLTFFGCSIA